VAAGDAGQPGHDQVVNSRSRMITSHQARIECSYYKSKASYTRFRPGGGQTEIAERSRRRWQPRKRSADMVGNLVLRGAGLVPRRTDQSERG
jgi:hypothetical protein